MTFGESINTCFSKYASFEGRASRSELWWWVLFVFLVSIGLSIVSQMISGLFSLATLLPSLAVTARRLHDTNRSGWLQLIGIIPLVGWIVVIVWCIQEAKEPNEYGAAPALTE
jgi:uncharacterized membrane protein YhaH (DUF805 family)